MKGLTMIQEEQKFNDEKNDHSAEHALIAQNDNETKSRADRIQTDALQDLAPDNSLEIKGGELQGQTVRIQFRTTTDFPL
ncbi:MAG TPA: hypothetical protein VF074_10095 [Pyrinomonadaceae bacterium]